MPKVDLPSLKSLSVKVQAPEPPGTDNVGDNDVETHDVGVTTDPKYIGTRIPVADPAGSAASVVGSPAPAAAERSSDGDDEQEVATSAIETISATTERVNERRMEQTLTDESTLLTSAELT